MLFPAAMHPSLVDGTVTVAFRRWKRPTVRAGGTLRYPGGVLAIDEVARIDPDEVTDEDARSSGAQDRDEVLARLADHDGELYRIRFHHLGDDGRVALAREDELDDAALEELRTRLGRLDERSPRGPWTRETLLLIADRPRVAAADLAAALDVERARLKRDVRKLKELGLTVSRSVGYELSPRGRAFLDLEGRRSGR